MKLLQPIFTTLAVTALLATSACDKKDDDPKKTGTGTGDITFFTPDITAHGSLITVTIDGDAKQITLSWASLPDCKNTQGTAHFTLEAGTYSYSTIDGHGATTFGNVNVFADDCIGKKLD